MKSPQARNVSRRHFLQVGGLPAATTFLMIADVRTTQAYDPGHEETKERYRESEHVKAFYRTNGYETLKK
jgi:hypothetical protein